MFFFCHLIVFDLETFFFDNLGNFVTENFFQATCTVCGYTFNGNRISFRYIVFTAKPSFDIRCEVAERYKFRIFEDSLYYKEDTNIGTIFTSIIYRV